MTVAFLRRALIWPAVLFLAALALPGAACAKPTVTIIKAELVPIPGFPHTGNILGAGTAVRLEGTIEGSEYFDSPPPVIGVNVYAPVGVKLHPFGFPTCDANTIETLGPLACPKGSAMGPVGKAVGFVTIGGERVEETAELFTFFAPGGGGFVLAQGHSPVSLEILATERLVKAGNSDGSGPEESFSVPLVASLPGAPYASVRSIDLEAGSAYRSHGHTIYFARLPATCPRGGWPARGEVIFAEDGEPSLPETVDVSVKLPCPNEKAAHRSRRANRTETR
jgi:hypothetical protein